MSDEQPESKALAEADDLIVRAKTDRAAFALLYERYFPEISKYCLRRLFVRTIAEDVVSTVFLEVASRLPAFSGRTDTDFRRWLFRIATNAINAQLRNSRRRQELWEAAARSGMWKPNGDANASRSDHDLRDWSAVYRALLELDERERTIVMLRFFSNCSYEEIAEIVAATPGAVRTALSRILTRLRERFQLPLAADSSSDQCP